MCAACVAQGIGYVGTALAGLQVMGARAKARRRSAASAGPVGAADAVGPVDEAELGVGSPDAMGDGSSAGPVEQQSAGV